MRAGYQITGVILQRDDGVLVSNRLEKSLPIVDEVLYIDRIPLGMLAAIEVAVPGKVIETLSNPYGIATVFNLNADETKNIVPMARALIGTVPPWWIKRHPETSKRAQYPPVTWSCRLRVVPCAWMLPPVPKLS